MGQPSRHWRWTELGKCGAIKYSSAEFLGCFIFCCCFHERKREREREREREKERKERERERERKKERERKRERDLANKEAGGWMAWRPDTRSWGAPTAHAHS